MSAWGNLDNVKIQGTVTAFTANTRVNGSSTAFTSNVKDGDYLTVDGSKYQVANVASDTLLFLTNVPANNVTGNVAFIQQGPKWVANANVLVEGTNVVSIQNIFGVDRVEIGVIGDAANATPHTGWVTYNTYTTEQGATRHKAEVLVAMSKNFNANATGTLQVDANDNAVYPNS